MRVARPTVDIERSITFWTRVVGFEVLSQFKDHAGYDGAIMGYPSAAWELEVTRHSSGSPLPTPTDEDIITLYVAADAADTIKTRMRNEEILPFEHPNSYWKSMGAESYTDPDGYTLIIFPTD